MATKDFENLTFISASAGSGKTHSLIEQLTKAICDDGIPPDKVIAVTFTEKAAQELQERLLMQIQQQGRFDLAERISQGLIGTVHSVCIRLLSDFAFELGLPFRQNVVTDAENEEIFKQALDESLDLATLVTVTNLTASYFQSERGQSVEDKWKRDVRNICEKCRTNNISVSKLDQLAKDSTDSLLAFFPNVTTRTKANSQKKLLKAVEQALKDINLRIDTTDATKNYVDRLYRHRNHLNSDACPWWVWIDLASSAPGAKSRAIAASVRQAAEIYLQLKEFQEGLRELTETIMGVAASTLNRYSELKSELGVIDFVDMEHLTYRALSDEVVMARLSGAIDLMVVDEFQDTSPIQLAIFSKLATFAKRMVFVGDVKQSIYRFREADVNLVLQTRDDILKHGASHEILDRNWRSNADLVEYVNTNFTKVFSGVMKPKEVKLSPEVEKIVDEPGLLRWTVKGTNPEFLRCIVQQIKDLVNSDVKYIVDRNDGVAQSEPRTVEYGDIAVLVRTNNYLTELANQFKSLAVPVKVSLPNLLDTPEIVLSLACLRRLNDPMDSYATAEIVSLSDSEEPESWLSDRLDWLQTLEVDGQATVDNEWQTQEDDEANAEPNPDWKEETHRIVRRLAEIRTPNLLRSPVEIVAYVINEVGVRYAVAAWGPTLSHTEQRQANLDALLNLATSYEDWSARKHEAATLTGFLVWIETIRDTDLNRQSMTLAASDSVHVSTFHGAKGLEWPVVVVVDLYRKPRFDFGGVHIVKPNEFSAKDPLRDRGVHYWPNPFGSRSSGIEVVEAIQDSEWGQDRVAAEEAELHRLMYVALTRPKDLLVIANKHNSGTNVPNASSIIGELYDDAFDFCSPPATGSIKLDDGHSIDAQLIEMDIEGIEEPQDFEESEKPVFAPNWFIYRDLAEHQRRIVLPSQAPQIPAARMGKEVKFADRIRISTHDMTAFGNAVHAILAMEFVNPRHSDRIAKAKAIMRAYGVREDAVELDAVFDSIAKLNSKLTDVFSARSISIECPVAHSLPNGQHITGYVDLLVETEKGLIIVDHKANPRRRDTWHEQVSAYSGQLATYQHALNEIQSVRSTWLNFIVPGSLVEVELPTGHR